MWPARSCAFSLLSLSKLLWEGEGSWSLTHPGEVEQGVDWVGLGSIV